MVVPICNQLGKKKAEISELRHRRNARILDEMGMEEPGLGSSDSCRLSEFG